MSDDTPVTDAGTLPAWHALRARTIARIALPGAGGSIATGPLLDFQHAHARARDAVHAPFDVDAVERDVCSQGWSPIRVHSRAPDRTAFLQRPDWGRRLDDASVVELRANAARTYDAVFVIADGLSTRAVEAHAVDVLIPVCETLRAWNWRVGPVVIASQSRVALGDEVGEILHAGQVAILIGERPGLSAADSLGIYLTHSPQVGCTDAGRNCISNIHVNGQSVEEAAHRLLWLMREAAARGGTGTALKDGSDRAGNLIHSTVESVQSERTIPSSPSDG